MKPICLFAVAVSRAFASERVNPVDTSQTNKIPQSVEASLLGRDFIPSPTAPLAQKLVGELEGGRTPESRQNWVKISSWSLQANHNIATGGQLHLT